MSIQEILNAYDGLTPLDFSGPVTDQTINVAEQELGIQFPPQYRSFLRFSGSGSVSSESFFGLGGARHLDVVWITKTLREKKTNRILPLTMLPLRTDGFGNYDCIDFSKPTLNGEYAIVEWLHDADTESNGRVLAQSYFEWFRSILEMIREIDGV